MSRILIKTFLYRIEWLRNIADVKQLTKIC